MTLFRPLLERFEEKVSPCPLTGCWWWTAGVDEDGYGKIWDGQETRRAPRVAFELFRGPIPDGLQVCHRCDQPLCVNPWHLFLGTPRDNTLDMYAKGRAPRLHLPPSCGEQNGRALLTWALVEAIRSRYASGGVTMAELGRHYGVTKWTIWDVLNRTWRTPSAPSTQLPLNEPIS